MILSAAYKIIERAKRDQEFLRSLNEYILLDAERSIEKDKARDRGRIFMEDVMDNTPRSK